MCLVEFLSHAGNKKPSKSIKNQNEVLRNINRAFIAPICFRSQNFVFSESVAVPWAGFEMQIPCIAMKLPFQTGKRAKKNLFYHFPSNLAFIKHDTKVKASTPFSPANSFPPP